MRRLRQARKAYDRAEATLEQRDAVIRHARDEGVAVDTIADELGIARSTVYLALERTPA